MNFSINFFFSATPKTFVACGWEDGNGVRTKSWPQNYRITQLAGGASDFELDPIDFNYTYPTNVIRYLVCVIMNNGVRALSEWIFRIFSNSHFTFDVIHNFIFINDLQAFHLS